MTQLVGTPVSTRRMPRRPPSRRSVLGIVGVALTVPMSWWLGAVHPGMHLTGVGDTLVCRGRLSADERDVVMGGLTFNPPRDAEILSVSLVDPVNTTLAGATVAPVSAPRGDGDDAWTAIPGGGEVWPMTPADRAQYTVDWSQERDLVGAHLSSGVEEAAILHIRVTDPSEDASYRAWRVEYRMDGTRWVSTFTNAFTMPAAVGPCS